MFNYTQKYNVFPNTQKIFFDCRTLLSKISKILFIFAVGNTLSIVIMATSNKIRLLPYGVSDFETIRKENKYYVDKTMFLPSLEENKYQFFLRPRRFGKSLMLNMVAAYYDVAFKDKFEALFSGLWIGKNPTEERNKYMILKFNFSTIDPDKEKVQKSFDTYVKTIIYSFTEKYEALLPKGTKEIVKAADNSNDAFTALISQVNFCNHRIYVIIDEYDNFVNTMLADSEHNYNELTHGDGFFRFFFNNLKAATSENAAAVARILISGVTPLTLSDVTSGFNIGKNISTRGKFNSLVGFTETEFRQMLEYYRDATGVFHHTVDELIEITKPWYDNNCFCTDSVNDDRMYNSDMALYFIDFYIANGGHLPTEMVDDNIKIDYNKMTKLIRFEKSFGDKTSLIQRVTSDGQIYAQIKTTFSLDELTSYENLVSLMYYMGLLSIGRHEIGRTLLIIPNATVNQQYFGYMKRCYDNLLSWKTDENILTELGYNFAYDGEHEPFLRYVASCMTDNSSNADFGKYGEAFVKGFMLSHIGTNTTFFTTYTEKELGHGYSDIYIEPRLGTPYAYVIELKYVPHKSSGAEIDKKLSQARLQLPKYITDKRLKDQAAQKGWNLIGIIMVFNGWELARYEVI